MREGRGAKEHFAAINSGHGFISFYKEVFGAQQIKRRYVIKGGPGTGKSSFMKKVAKEAEKRGIGVEYIRCSSDPESLDGVIIGNEIALLDGTAPHTYEPQIVGAADEIVNLGEFWDSDKLYTRYNEIAVLSALKSNSYSKAYRFLSAAMNVEKINADIAKGVLIEEKMLAAADRIMRSFGDGKGYSVEYGIIRAIGMGGRAKLDTYERSAKKLYCIYDCYGLGGIFLLDLIEKAREKRMRLKVSYDPLCPDVPDALFLVDEDCAFVIAEDGDIGADVKINMKRFVNSDRAEKIKSEYRANRRLCEALTDSAIEALSEAGKYHFGLEEIYMKCMDFESENKFTDEFCKKLFK